MPARVNTDGNPEDTVQIVVRLSLGLKTRAVAAAKAEDQSWTEFVKAAIKTAVEASERKR